MLLLWQEEPHPEEHTPPQLPSHGPVHEYEQPIAQEFPHIHAGDITP